MLHHYLTVALRSLAKSRVNTFINIFGLALGLAACLTILLYVRYEMSHDKWLPESERVYQVQATWHEPGQPVTRNQRSPFPVRDTIAAGFPEIEAVTKVLPGRMAVMRGGQPVWIDQVYVDPAFFDIFQLEFLRGSAEGALPNVNSVVLTETEAMKQFGTLDVVGEILREHISTGTFEYKVTGVVRDLPKNSHLELATIARYDPAQYANSPNFDWGSMGSYHYVKLRPGADAAAINARLPAWEKRVIPPNTVEGRTTTRADIMDLELVNVGDIHLGVAQGGAMRPGNDSRTVATFSVIAVLILVMACINFINLSTARAGQRAREVALRKVLGASRRQLIVQFLGESMLVVCLAMIIALALVELSSPWLAGWLEIDLRVQYLGEGGFLLPILLLGAGVGALGGLYPAMYLSRFQPARVLRANKSSAEGEASGRLRTVLVVTQFAISIGLIVCTAVIYAQTRFVETIDPGFERDGLIQMSGGGRLTNAGNFDAFKRQAEAIPGVAGVARTNLEIAAAENKTIILAQAPGAPSPTDIGFYRVDPAYFPTTGMRLLAGRLLGEAHAKDQIVRPAPGEPEVGPPLAERGLNVVVNRRAAMQLGFRDPAEIVGKQIRVTIDGGDFVPSSVVGVVEDTRIRTARDEVEPLIFGYDPRRASMMVIRYRGATPSAVMDGLRQVWAKFYPEIPFEADFAEDLVAEAYRQERARALIFLGFSIFAVLIASLGLFALAAFTTERRTKEIGIRKVLGAKIRDIVRLLTWQFSKPVVLANLIAWPVAWWAMRDWLNGFDVRIALTPQPFLLAGLLALAIAVGTVAGHALRVARLKPIHALRYE